MTKTQIESKYSKVGLKSSMYASYIIDKKLLVSTEGTSYHHVFLQSIFGHNDVIVQTTRKEHTRLHLLLVADNLDKLKTEEYSYELGIICLSCKLIQFNKDSKRHIYKSDLEFYEKYKNHIEQMISRLMSFWAKNRSTNTEYLQKLSKSMSKAITKLWQDPEYREKSLAARRTESFREKQRQLESDRWANCTEEEYNNWCESIARGTNAADKSNWGSKTKDLWNNEDYREHMHLVHTREYRLQHDPEFVKQEKERFLRKFKWDQHWVVEHLMDMNKYPSRAVNRNLGYTRLYNHKYLLEMCDVQFDFEEDLLRNNQLLSEDYDDVPRQYYWEDEVPFEDFREHVQKLFN